MTASRLTLRTQPDERVDLSAIDPVRLTALPQGELARLPIGTTRRGPLLGDLFDIHVGDEDLLVFEGGSPHLDRAGAGLSGGTIRVIGGVGHFAGRGMTGGRIEIDGDAGDFLGGAVPGAMAGMSGGEIVVTGNAGLRAGDRLRRGTIIIAGDAGPYAGARMIAGTLVVGGACADGMGQLMRRGTIILASERRAPPASFVDNGAVDAAFAALLARLVPQMPAVEPVMRRYAGDMATLGKGEIFAPII